MSTYTHGVTATIAGVPEIALRVISATITLDEDWTPYVQGTIVIPSPAPATLDRLDPREDVVVRVTLTGVGGPTSYTLGLRSRSFDRVADTLTLELASDEARLMDLANVSHFPDTSNFARFASLRSIINWALSKIPYPVGGGLSTIPGSSPDRGFNTDKVNLCENSRAGTNLTNISVFATGTPSTASRITGISGVSGGTGARVTVTNATTYMDVRFGSNLAGIIVEPERIYSVSARMAASITGQGRLYVQWYDAAGVSLGTTTGELSACSPAMSNYSINAIYSPPGAAFAVLIVRALGTIPAGGSATATSVAFCESPAIVPTDHGYFDGAFTDTASYQYDWAGTPYLSQSIRTALVDRVDEELLEWQPGQTLWDFLRPLIEEAGLRLYCRSPFVWTLEAPQVTYPGTVVAIVSGLNTQAGVETLSRDSDWYDSVVILWKWTDAAGVANQASGVAGVAGGKTLLLEHAYPGPAVGGDAIAAAILTRTQRRGIINTFDVLADFSVRPGVTIAGDTTGACSAVTFRLPASVMQLTTRLDT